MIRRFRRLTQIFLPWNCWLRTLGARFRFSRELGVTPWDSAAEADRHSPRSFLRRRTPPTKQRMRATHCYSASPRRSRSMTARSSGSNSLAAARAFARQASASDNRPAARSAIAIVAQASTRSKGVCLSPCSSLSRLACSAYSTDNSPRPAAAYAWASRPRARWRLSESPAADQCKHAAWR